MMRTYIYLALLTLSVSLAAQPVSKQPAKPKLVIGLVVDQMRWDYLYRFESKYGNDGFRKLLAEGYVCEYAHYNYVPTYTAPGHASIYTGSVPAIHGIIGNNWYDEPSGKRVYCVSDTNYLSVGTPGGSGKRSPQQLLTTTVGDELKLSNGNHSKVIGIALKDRSAVLPAGHAADAAYWMDSTLGQWITSTYYRNDLPEWVQQQNQQIAQQKNGAAVWKTLLPLIAYTECSEDDAPWEEPYGNESHPVFTHDVSSLIGNADVLKHLPYGNTVTLNAAKAAIEGEKLGSGPYTDMLCVSLSSTDEIQHQFGINSVESGDTYLRLDKDLSDFLAYLDAKFGRDNYVLFLTADHGGANNASFSRSYKVQAGNKLETPFRTQVDSFLQARFGDPKLVRYVYKNQVYLNEAAFQGDPAKRSEVKTALAAFIKSLPGVANVVDQEALSDETLPEKYKTIIANGYNPKRSGDLYIYLEPAWMFNYLKGSDHSTLYAYDTHVPLIFFGWNIKPAKDYSEISITDIAPTISQMLKIQEPNGCIGKPITGVLK